MTWYLESEKIEELRPMFAPYEIDDAKVWIEIDQDGVANLVVEKKGKRQKKLWLESKN